MVLFLLDPIYLITMVFGYIVMFLIALKIAPSVANRFSGKFSLYTSMFIVGLLTVSISSLTIYGISLLISNYFGLFSITTNVLMGILIAVIILNLLIYLLSPWLINLVYGARKDNTLQSMVDSVARRLKLNGNFKAVVVNGFPNAFAYGNFIFGKHVAVTNSMIKLVNKSELEAVIGHELGHHKHRDNLIMLLFGLLPSIIYYLGYFLIRMPFYYRSERRNGSPIIFMLVGFGAIAISFIVQILILAFSRLREYFADMEGAIAAGKENMKGSLIKLDNYYKGNIEALVNTRDSRLRCMFIYAFANALANPLISKASESGLAEFLSSHPPIEKRLKFLDKLKVL